MKNFLKDNWFKLVIAFIVLLIGTSFFSYYVTISRKEKAAFQQQNDFDLQKKCSTVANAYFKNSDYTENQIATYTNHYNKKLNKCFISIISSNIVPENGAKLTYKSLIDASEGKLYAKVHEFLPKDSLISQTIVCELLDTTCSSPIEYNFFIKSYMEE